MKFFTLTTILALATAAIAAPKPPPTQPQPPQPKPPQKHTVAVTYSENYDNPQFNMNGVACSNGPTGMEKFGYTKLGQLPGFPYVGGGFVVGGWGSPNCGTCWKLTYQGKSVFVEVVDHSAEGTFNIALKAMNKLTGNQAVNLGRVTATFEEAPVSSCRKKQ